MPAKLIIRKKEYQIQPGITLSKVMKELNIKPESVIPIQDGELITEDLIISEGDIIRLVPVISGG